jgi:epoxyqueuosine reductase
MNCLHILQELTLPTSFAISEFLQKQALALGFDLAGIASASEIGQLAYFPEWLGAGHAGEMRYLESRNERGELKRSALENHAPWARSVIVCAINYNTDQPHSTESHDPNRGWISRYAWSQTDYHDAVLAKMRELESSLIAFVESAGEERPRTWCYVDTGPLVERAFAARAGTGWTGKNTCIINQEIGSWMFLATMLTSLELEPSAPAADRCGTCTRCIDACPTDALIEPYKMDARRCISYLTIEKRGQIPADLRSGLGNHLFGCDICQDVCPWNRRAQVTTDAEFQPRTELVNPLLTWIADMNQEGFRSAFRGSPIKRTKLSGLRRNAAIAMGNSGQHEFIPQLEQMALDEDSNVAEHARWALERLRDKDDDENTSDIP